jgi:ubiquinone/menaquinone biosynthesis C-methylase UbiE
MTKRGYNVIGVDFSESQLKKAKEKALANNLRIEFQKQDARKLTFLNESPEYVPAYFFW